MKMLPPPEGRPIAGSAAATHGAATKAGAGADRVLDALATDSLAAAELAPDLLAALCRPPAVAIPSGFACRVASQAVVEAARPSGVSTWGLVHALGLGAGAFLVLLLFALAAHAQPTFRSLTFDLELCLLPQLGVLGWWLGRECVRAV